jgi:cardiolipin synthase A/B
MPDQILRDRVADCPILAALPEQHAASIARELRCVRDLTRTETIRRRDSEGQSGRRAGNETDTPVRRRSIGRRMILAGGAAGLLSGCASIPDIESELDDGRLRHRILGTPGALSRRQSDAVITAMPESLRGDALQRQFALQAALSQAPLVFGNTATLLQDGTQALPAIFQALEGARDHINLEYFIFDNVHCAGTTLLDVLVDRARHGVRINVIYDAYGSRGTPAAFFDELRRVGVKIVTFNPLDPLQAGLNWSPNDRDHRKIAVIDGKLGFTGGINMDRVYENPPSVGIPPDGSTAHAYWRDIMVRISGPAVAELQKLFFGTWKAQKGPPISPANYFPPLPRTGVQTIRIIGSTPGDDRPLYYVSLLTAIRNARHSIMLSSGYFVPPQQEREDLAAAARNGVSLDIVAPSRSDVDAAVYAGRAAYGDLLEAGARIYEVQDAVLHAKIAVVDSVWSVIGSSNLDRRSVVFNNEVDAIILGQDTAQQVEGVLHSAIAASHQITLDRWSARPLHEHWREWQARLWEYWM